MLVDLNFHSEPTMSVVTDPSLQKQSQKLVTPKQLKLGWTKNWDKKAKLNSIFESASKLHNWF